MSTIVLEKDQKKHAKELNKILDVEGFCIDCSTMGTGKTFIHTYIGNKKDLPFMVVCPKGMIVPWKDHMNKHELGVENDAKGNPLIVTYESFRSTKGKVPKHGLLSRNDKTCEIFTINEAGKSLIDRGVYIVFDEFHNLRNSSAQNKSVLAIMKYFHSVKDKTRTKIAFLSATPFDKPNVIVNLTNLFGYTKMGSNSVKDILFHAKRIDPVRYERFVKDNKIPIQSKNGKFIYSVFSEVINPNVSRAMILKDIECTFSVKNLFCSMTEEEQDEYEIILKNLDREMKGRWSLGKVVKLLICLQISKTIIMIRLLNHVLETMPNHKIVLFADYHEVFDVLRDGISEECLELTGLTKNRDAVVKKFQEPNLNHRVIIANPTVGGVGISLHDTTGKFPRVAFIMPGYKSIELHQATGRFYRRGAKGEADVRFIYGQLGETEQKILRKISQKGKVMKELVDQDGELNFFSDYHNVIEHKSLDKYVQKFKNKEEIAEVSHLSTAIREVLKEL